MAGLRDRRRRLGGVGRRAGGRDHDAVLIVQQCHVRCKIRLVTGENGAGSVVENKSDYENNRVVALTMFIAFFSITMLFPIVLLAHVLKSDSSLLLNPFFWLSYLACALPVELFGHWLAFVSLRKVFADARFGACFSLGVALCVGVLLGVSPWSEEFLIGVFLAPFVFIPLAFGILLSLWLLECLRGGNNGTQ